jgi:glycyl-tRNA synthetase beta chain
MKAELFVELFCEELPADMVMTAVEGLRAGLVGLLAGVEHGEARIYATPRRLAVCVDDVAMHRPETERLVTGPSADKAFDAAGAPTGMAVGFAKGKGVDVSALEVIDSPKGKVIAVRVKEGGESTAEVVTHGLEALVLGLPFAKSMEWGEGGIRWGRPLHRVSAVFGGRVLHTTVANIAVSARTFGHRLADDPEFSFTDCASWLAGLRHRYVEPDLDVRRKKIEEILEESAAQLAGDRIDAPELLDEVLHLVEWPVKILGTFDEALLELPPRLLITSMRVNQRYFPVHRDGQLTNRFVIVGNNPLCDRELVAQGNARVLRARFVDARFFLAEDKKKRLEAHGEKLEAMRWIRGLGSMAQKQDRLGRLAGELAPLFGADPAVASRAGALAKCDLTSLMVGEFGELQGHMGMIYAAAQGESADVAQAIEDQYQPRFAGDTVAKSPAGAALAVAERLDALVGCFGIGMAPKGGGDPQGLRRAANGLIETLRRYNVRVDLRGVFEDGLAVFHEDAKANAETFGEWLKLRGTDADPKGEEALLDELVAFAIARFKAEKVSDGVSADLVDAALGANIDQGATDVVELDARVRALANLADKPDFGLVLQTVKRVLNITKGAAGNFPARDALAHPAEQALHDAVSSTFDLVYDAITALDFEAATGHALGLREPVAALFDAVMVDDPDPAIKANRVGLLLRCASVFTHIADFSRISSR